MKRILVCPLDWGLGHATRCIPVIRELQKQNAEVIIASSGSALELLKIEFPDHQFFSLVPYAPEYPSSGNLMFNLIGQLSKFRKAIRTEHEQLEELVRDNKIDAVISDNRYGCWSRHVRSVLITHQMNPLMPDGFGWMRPVSRLVFRKYIQSFDEVWIPDEPASGMTALFNSRGRNHSTYIGWLSRFTLQPKGDLQYEILALVSGPEPQREILEKLLTEQLKTSGRKCLLVAGVPSHPFHKQDGNLEIVNHLTGSELGPALLSAGLVISRSGYSTIMDLMTVGGKAIFIPTPGQPEQLFLAEYFKSKQIAFAMSQDVFDLQMALQETEKYRGWPADVRKSDYLAKAISKLLS